MVTVEQARMFALAFEGSEEAPHFEIHGFKVKGKIFMTLNVEQQHVTLRLSPADQAMFADYYPGVVYPVNSAWGRHGWTHVSLKLAEQALMESLVRMSYCLVAPKRLASKYQEEGE